MKGAAKGTTFNINSKAVGELTSIGAPSMSADTIDVTTLDSVDGFRDFIAGLKDGGEVPLSGLFDGENEGQQELLTAFYAGTKSPCTIVFPTAIGYTWTFNAVVTAIGGDAELENAVSFEATLKVSGKPTLAATSAG